MKASLYLYIPHVADWPMVYWQPISKGWAHHTFHQFFTFILAINHGPVTTKILTIFYTGTTFVASREVRLYKERRKWTLVSQHNFQSEEYFLTRVNLRRPDHNESYHSANRNHFWMIFFTAVYFTLQLVNNSFNHSANLIHFLFPELVWHQTELRIFKMGLSCAKHCTSLGFFPILLLFSPKGLS